MTFCRKHSRTFALLAVLMALAAAPYLIPENPDSPIFRSGTLGFLLLMACFFPVQDALRRISQRALIHGLLLGLLFAAALSLGSELFIYDGLLPGMGSALRRAAVPVLAAPLLGCLCAHALAAQPLRPAAKPLHLPLPVTALILFACWLPVLLAFYPGMLNYDFAAEYTQHLERQYSNLHPLLHSALMNGVITLGETLASRTLGVLLMSLLQMVCFAFALGYSCCFAQRRGAPTWALILLTACYGLMPVFSVLSVSMTKDTLFAAAVFVFALKTGELIQSPDAFLGSLKNCIFYVFLGIVTALMRNNGVFALVLTFPALLVVQRGYRKRVFALLAACVGGSAAVSLVLSLILNPASPASFQLYSLPAQQLVRAYNSDLLSDADREEIRSWYTDDAGLVVHAHLGDSAKGYLNRERIEAEGGAFLQLWLKHAKDAAPAYIEAFLMLNVGSWYPDDLSHSTIYPDVSYNDKGYLQLQEYDGEAFGIETRSYLPAVRNLFERICRRNIYQKYPILPILFATATPFWLILLGCMRLCAHRRVHFLPAVLGILGLWLSYLFGPCTLPRYILPLYCLAPVLLLTAFLPASNKE